jgi:hypothetical protein
MGIGSGPSGDERIIKQLTSDLKRQENQLLESKLNVIQGSSQSVKTLQLSAGTITSSIEELDQIKQNNARQHGDDPVNLSFMSFIKKGKFNQNQIDHLLRDKSHGYTKYARECEGASYTLCDICGM